MKSFLAALAFAVIAAFVASSVLDTMQQPSSAAYHDQRREGRRSRQQSDRAELIRSDVERARQSRQLRHGRLKSGW